MLGKWWVRGLLVGVAWIVLCIGAGIVHTEVILKGQLSPAEDEALSGKYGMAAGIGLVAAFVLANVLWSRKRK
jgi:hypothetical protein